MILFPHTALLALLLSLLGYSPPLPARTVQQPTCQAFDHPAAYFHTCPAYYNSSSTPAPLFGSVDRLDGPTAFAIIQAAAPPPPPLPTFASLPFLPPLTNHTSSSDSSLYHLLLLHTSADPFSLHLLPQFHLLARRFPRIHFLAVECDGEDVYAFHPLINTSVTLPFPFISTSPAPPTTDVTVQSTASSWSSLWSGLRSLLSLSEWWLRAPALPPPSAVAPSLSFSSHYLVRGLPSLLLFHSSSVQQPNIRWPRTLAQLTQHIAQATNQQPESADNAMEELYEEEEPGELTNTDEYDESIDDDVNELDELFGVTSELDYGLLFGVVGMSVVHWLHRLKDKLERWEVEALAVQHVAM